MHTMSRKLVVTAVLGLGVYEFLFVFTPTRIRGATGSIGRPLAIR